MFLGTKNDDIAFVICTTMNVSILTWHCHTMPRIQFSFQLGAALVDHRLNIVMCHLVPPGLIAPGLKPGVYLPGSSRPVSSQPGGYRTPGGGRYGSRLYDGGRYGGAFQKGVNATAEPTLVHCNRQRSLESSITISY